MQIRIVIGDGSDIDGVLNEHTLMPRLEVENEEAAFEECEQRLKKLVKKEQHVDLRLIKENENGGHEVGPIQHSPNLARWQIITDFLNSEGDIINPDDGFDNCKGDFYTFMYVGFEKINGRTLTLYDVFDGITCESAHDYWIESLKRNDLDDYVSDYLESMLLDNEEIYLSQEQIDLICEKLLHFYRTDSGSCFSAFWYDNYKMPLSEIEITS